MFFSKWGLNARAARNSVGCALSLVIPTYNEAGNIGPLLERLEQMLAGRTWEVLFVDDNPPNGTTAVVRRAAETRFNVVFEARP